MISACWARAAGIAQVVQTVAAIAAARVFIE
jgi:hypothetical protein